MQQNALVSELDRQDTIALMIHACKIFDVQDATKYSALSYFSDRFLTWLESENDHNTGVVMFLIRRKSLQFIGLVFLWIASKIHETKPLPVAKLRIAANKLIPDFIYTPKDFTETEILLIKAINFNLRTGGLIFDVVFDLLSQLRSTAKVGKLVSLQSAIDIVDLLYQTGEFNFGIVPTNVAAASIVAAAYILCVPVDKCQFPVLAWLASISNVSSSEVVQMTKRILSLIEV